MDIVTHGLLGALAAQSASPRSQTRLAACIGFASALLVDADAFIRSAEDALLVLEYHRHFTHALIFVPIGALIASLLLWPLIKRHLPFRNIYVYAFLGYGTAGFLDACTSYGTHLLWPFSNTAIDWSIIAIIDPVFSLILLVGLIAAWSLHDRKRARWALVIAAGYLALGTLQHQRAALVAEKLATERGLVSASILVKPTIGNLLLWRAITISNGKAYVDAVRVGLIGENITYPGKVAHLIDPETWQNLPKESAAYHDLQRFYAFSNKLLVAHPEQPNLIGDLRYSMLPTGTEPMWGIRLAPSRPEQRAAFEVNREFSGETRTRFMEMLMGKDIPS